LEFTGAWGVSTNHVTLIGVTYSFVKVKHVERPPRSPVLFYLSCCRRNKSSVLGFTFISFTAPAHFLSILTNNMIIGPFVTVSAKEKVGVPRSASAGINSEM
jgi:hypothetical protein